MPKAIRRCSVLTGVALCAVLGGGVGVAQANDNTLRVTINAFAPKIARDEIAIKHGLSEYPKGKPLPLVKALTREATDLHALQKKLTKEHASSAQGKKAKGEIVSGLSMIISSEIALLRDIQAAHGGAVPSATVKAAVALDQKGRAKYKAGLILLG